MILGVLQWYHNGRFIGSSSFKERWTSVFPVFGLYVPGQSIAIDFQASQPKMSRSWAFSTVRKRLEFRSIAGPKKSLGWPVGMSQEILSWPRETFTLELTYPQDPHSNQSVTSNIRIAVVSPEEKWKPFQQWPKTLLSTGLWTIGGYNCYIECVDVYVLIMFCVPFQCRMTFYDNDSPMKHI